MRYYSFAGDARGQTDPVEAHIYDVEGSDCGVDGCVDDNCHHTVIMWSGNEYSKDHTWIAAESDYVVDLNEVR